MTEATTALLTTNDGRPLKAALATAQARAKRGADNDQRDQYFQQRKTCVLT